MTQPRNKEDGFDLSASLAFASKVGGGADGAVEVVYTNGERKKYESLASLQSSDDLEGVLDAISAGRVFSVDYTVLSFINKHNANNFKLKDGHVARGAKDTEGRPVLKDHRVGDSDSEVGVCGSSEVTSVRGVEAMKTRVSARQPAFMSSFVRGMHRAYSAHFTPDGQVSCGVCGQKGEMYGGRWAMLECGHRPGFTVKDGDHKGKVGHYVFGVSGFKELSATPNPAVQGARAMGAAFAADAAHTEEEDADMAQKEGTPVADGGYIEKYAVASADLRASQQEVTDLKAKIEVGQGQLTKLKQERDRWKEKALSAAIRSLQDKGVITNDPDELEIVKLSLNNDFDKGLAFFSKRAPRGDVAASSFGVDGGNPDQPKDDGSTIKATVFGVECDSLVAASRAAAGAGSSNDGKIKRCGFGQRDGGAK